MLRMAKTARQGSLWQLSRHRPSQNMTAYNNPTVPYLCTHFEGWNVAAGLDLPQRLVFPISHEATLFSTPEDLRELEQLFAAHPYPQHKCYNRKGHGFFLLGRSVEVSAGKGVQLFIGALHDGSSRRMASSPCMLLGEGVELLRIN